jgi:hypothetical protein
MCSSLSDVFLELRKNNVSSYCRNNRSSVVELPGQQMRCKRLLVRMHSVIASAELFVYFAALIVALVFSMRVSASSISSFSLLMVDFRKARQVPAE